MKALKGISFLSSTILSLSLLLFFQSCEDPKAVEENGFFQAELTNAHAALTEAIIEDGFSPPVASRIYANTYLAGYECIVLGDDKYPDLTGYLNDFNGGIDEIEVDDEKFIPEIAAIRSMMDVATGLVYRKFIIEAYLEAFDKKIEENGFDKAAVTHSMQVGKLVAKAILDYSSTDNYRETRDMPFHNIPEEWGAWEPTPPLYGTAIEPHWSKIRPFFLDSIEQYVTHYNLNYDTVPNSEFYNEALVVYKAVRELTDEQTAQANHWDCNPRETLTSGHMVTQIKQMNPDGHWLGIAHTVMSNLETSFQDKIYSCAYTALIVADAFIVCWDEKYSTNLIRPETYINRFIDEDWHPILETPLFPEYTSGHSVVSGAASTVLTELVGDEHAYIDSVNFRFGLPPRSFESFTKAADEAAMSRLYAGIHYMPAVENGVAQGRAIASDLLNLLPRRKSE